MAPREKAVRREDELQQLQLSRRLLRSVGAERPWKALRCRQAAVGGLRAALRAKRERPPRPALPRGPLPSRLLKTLLRMRPPKRLRKSKPQSRLLPPSTRPSRQKPLPQRMSQLLSLRRRCESPPQSSETLPLPKGRCLRITTEGWNLPPCFIPQFTCTISCFLAVSCLLGILILDSLLFHMLVPVHSICLPTVLFYSTPAASTVFRCLQCLAMRSICPALPDHLHPKSP